MIPYPYNFVDMGGIDLAEIHGQTVEGLYSRIVEAATACGEVVLYNWKFAEIEISPQHANLLITSEAVTINGEVQVTEQDEVLVPGIVPPAPDPHLVELNVVANGAYDPIDYDADGFDTVNVNVPSSSLAYHWDFSESLVDKIVGVEAIVSSGVSQGENGLTINAGRQYIQLGTQPLFVFPRFVEIEFGEMNLVNNNYHHTLITFGPTNGDRGLLFRVNTIIGWSFFDTGWRPSFLPGIENLNYFSNKRLGLYYTGSAINVYVDGVLLATSEYNLQNNALPFTIGNGRAESSGGNAYTTLIKSVKVFIKNPYT